MILLALFNLIFAVLKVLFGWLSLPAMPDDISSVVAEILGYIKNGLPILWLFVDKSLTGTCLVVAVACMNFDKIYDMLMWILAKIPIGIRKN